MVLRVHPDRSAPIGGRIDIRRSRTYRPVRAAFVAGVVAAVAGATAGLGGRTHTAPYDNIRTTRPTIDSPTGGTLRMAYEWHDTTWSRSVAAYAPTLTSLRRLGVTDLVVDITRSITYVRSGTRTQLTTYLTTFRRLVAEGRSYGVTVRAVVGDPSWSVTGSNAGLQAVGVMQQLDGLTVGAAPAGLEFDVEPWSRPGWPTKQAAYSSSYVTFVRSIAAAWNRLGIAGSLGFAVPSWFDGQGGAVPKIRVGVTTAYPMTQVLSALASVPSAYLNVMTYRRSVTGVDGTLARFGPVTTSAAASRSGVSLFLGQDVTANPVATTTLAGETLAQMQATFTTLQAAYADQPPFAGLEVNDAEGLLGAVGIRPGARSNGF